MLTEPNEWRFVPGKLNIADMATRSGLIEEDEMSEIFKRWIEGPAFLLEPEEQWPEDIKPEKIQDEMRSSCKFTALHGGIEIKLPVINWSEHGSMKELRRTIAGILTIQRKVRKLPELHPAVQDASLYRDAYERLQALLNIVWEKWQKEYLPTLISRAKWHNTIRDLAVNDTVLLIDQGLPRGKWRLGRIIDVYPGRDGHVRSVKVRTVDGDYERPTVRCCLLICLLIPSDQAPVTIPEDEPGVAHGDRDVTG